MSVGIGLLLADPSVSELGHDLQVAEVTGVLLNQVKQDALKCRWVSAIPARAWLADLSKIVALGVGLTRSFGPGGMQDLRLSPHVVLGPLQEDPSPDDGGETFAVAHSRLLPVRMLLTHGRAACMLGSRP